MPQLCTRDQCTGCSACASVCPKRCILMEKDSAGFLYPRIDTDTCIDCGLCERSCPVIAEKPTDSMKRAYAAYNRDPVIRKNSSSGGIFSGIAQCVIQQNGVVFGAKLDETMGVVHGYADTVEGLAAFRGSKYVQSKIGDTYRQVEEFLKQRRPVLFSGTPCQIGGLKSYLGKPYDNLICQDIICHGVPAPFAWEQYIAELEAKRGDKVSAVAFRDKVQGWSSYSIRIDFENGNPFYENKNDNVFMAAFLGDYCLRHSCYQCDFKTENRQSDITLADFWGIEHVIPEMNDDCGTSLVLIHSEKGQELLKKAEKMLEMKQVDWSQAISYNPAMVCSVDRPGNRERFLGSLKERPFSDAVCKYCKPTLREWSREKYLQIRYLPNRILLTVLGDKGYEKLN